MKSVFFTLLLASSLAHAGPHFSAFSNNGILYVTVLGDCNELHASIYVGADICPVGSECHAVLSASSLTKKACPNIVKPYIFQFDLSQSYIGNRVQRLNLNYNQETIVVDLNNKATNSISRDGHGFFAPNQEK